MPHRSRATQSNVERGAWVIDCCTGIMSGDAAYAHVAGLDAAALASGLPLREVTAPIHSDDQARMVVARRQTIIRDAPFRITFQRLVRGTYRHLLAVGEPRRNAAGQVVAIRGTTEDVTDQIVGHALLERVFQTDPATPLEVCADRLIEAKLAAQTARQPGIARLLDMALLEAGQLLAREIKDGPQGG